jgi:carboxypeptidase family protein
LAVKGLLLFTVSMGAALGILRAATIDGTIVEHPSGMPLRSASVTIRKAGETASIDQFVTDVEGRFRSPELSPGKYRADVSKPGYGSLTSDVKIPSGTQSIRTMIALTRYTVITGRVTDPQGNAIRDAKVFAMVKSAEDRPAWRTSEARPGAYALVDEHGQYRLYGLAPANYAVAVQCDTYRGAPPSRGVRGVYFYPSNSRPLLFAVSGGEEYSDIDLVITPTQAYTVSGRVATPTPNTKYSVAIVPVEEPALAIGRVQTEGTDGSFRFDGIPPGSYNLFASGPMLATGGQGAVLGSGPLFGQLRVDVQQHVEGILIPVGKGRSVGLVLRHEAPNNPDANCPQRARLTLRALEDVGALVQRTAEAGLTSETVIDDLPPVHYMVSVSGLGESCYQLTRTVVDLSEAVPVSHVSIPVSPAGSIRGRLKDGARPSEVAIMLAAAGPFDGEALILIAFAGDGSHFVFENVRPGRYRALAYPAAEALKPGWAKSDRMIEIEVRGGVSSEVQLSVPSAQFENSEKKK